MTAKKGHPTNNSTVAPAKGTRDIPRPQWKASTKPCPQAMVLPFLGALDAWWSTKSVRAG
jgi:hypothetical protein